MTSKLYGNAGFAFANWRPAKDQLRQLLESMGLKVNGVYDLPVSFGGSRLEAYIEETPDMNLSDLIASLEGHRAAVNINVTIYTGPPEPPPATPHNFAPRINQKVIDLFRAVFGADFWAVVTRAGLADMAASPAARQAAYVGPDVEDLPLTPDEQDALIAAIKG
jgi:hypothetical protein